MFSDDDFVRQIERILTFPPGTTAVTFAFGNLDDDINEGLESFSAELSSPKNGLILGIIFTARVDIIDNDGKEVIFVSTTSLTLSFY